LSSFCDCINYNCTLMLLSCGNVENVSWAEEGKGLSTPGITSGI